MGNSLADFRRARLREGNRLSRSIESIATRLGVPSSMLTEHRLRLPDGIIFYPHRFRWCLLIKAVVEEFCPRFTPGAAVAYIGDTETKFLHLDAAYLEKIGITLDAGAKMPDVVVHDHRRNWLVLIEAVTSAGPVDGKRRMELKKLFKNSKAGLVFVTAFETRKVMQSFVSQISWETAVWIAEDPDHLIHFNGERFLGPYADAMPDGYGRR